jgi:DeoR/GlpR family transcriptional regulator of sugar metabolism
MKPDLFLKQRHALIQERLAASGKVIAADLAEEFGVSEDTIRRDLRDMAAAGLCERVYGGALPPAPFPGGLSVRTRLDPERKAALAAVAVREIRDGMFVFFDVGSTNLAIAKALPPGLKITAATNAPIIAAALMEHEGVNVIVIGGAIDRETGAAVGAEAVSELRRLRPDLCILGACGIDRDAGVTSFGYEDSIFKRHAVEQSRSVMAAVTSEKLGTAAPFSVAPLAACGVAAFESDADPDFLSHCRGLGIKVLQPSRASLPEKV